VLGRQLRRRQLATHVEAVPYSSPADGLIVPRIGNAP